MYCLVQLVRRELRPSFNKWLSRGVRPLPKSKRDFFKTVRPTSPIKRFITPNEVAPLGQQYEMINKILLAGLERILKQAGAK